MQTIMLIIHHDYDIPPEHYIFEYSSLDEFINHVDKIADANDVIRDNYLQNKKLNELCGYFNAFFPRREWRKDATIMLLDTWLIEHRKSLIFQQYINGNLTDVEGDKQELSP